MNFFKPRSVDSAISGLRKAMSTLQEVQEHAETEADIAHTLSLSYMVERDEATEEAERAERIFSKLEELLK